MMKILYDGHIYALQVAGGISRYFAEIIRQLPADCQPIVTTYPTTNLNYPTHPHLQSISYRALKFRPSRFAYWLSDTLFQATVRRQSFNLLHPTYYSLMANQSIESCGQPIVLTVWDFLHERFADRMDPTGVQREAKRRAILAAQVLLCISENTRQDLVERYPTVADRAIVIPLAAGLNPTLTSSEPISRRPYFLYVGSRDPAYKNFDRLLSAFAQVVTRYPDLQLGVVGNPFTPTEQQAIASLNLEPQIQLYPHATDAQLVQLYRQSLALVYPSQYEGFGIPPLEAMACGTAVIAANASSIPEVVGNAALLFDPTSIDELTDRLLELIDQPALRSSLINQGAERAQAFSWQQTAAQTLEVYRSLCET